MNYTSCKNCENKTLNLNERIEYKKGMSHNLQLCCTSCDFTFEFYTSGKLKTIWKTNKVSEKLANYFTIFRLSCGVPVANIMYHCMYCSLVTLSSTSTILPLLQVLQLREYKCVSCSYASW